MQTTYHIEVTADDIKDGLPGRWSCCPVALACTRVFNGLWLYVGTQAVMVGLPMGRTFEHSEVVAKFIKAFDAGEPVQPFSFELV